MSRKEREEIVATLSKRMQQTTGLVVLDYTGLSVEKITGLRRQIRDAGSEFRVAKNTLLKIAVKDTPFEALNDSFVGQTGITFLDGDPAQTAKVLTDFAKENANLSYKVRAGVLEKTVLSEQDITSLGNLPSREVLLGQLVGVLASPLTGFVSVLADVPRKFLRTLTAIADQKTDTN